jgi:hypothetical protein
MLKIKHNKKINKTYKNNNRKPTKNHKKTKKNKRFNKNKKTTKKNKTTKNKKTTKKVIKKIKGGENPFPMSPLSEFNVYNSVKSVMADVTGEPWVNPSPVEGHNIGFEYDTY